MIKQAFTPGPGRVAVVREAVDEALSTVRREDGTEVKIVGAAGGLYSTDVEYRRAINPWALVVGVGAARKTDYGTTIETDIRPGDKVLVAEVGKNVQLAAGDEVDYIYVVPFEGVVGTLEWACGADGCGYKSRREFTVCPQCPTIAKPTISDVLGVSAR